MNKLGEAAREIHKSDYVNNDREKLGLHPLSRIFITFLYLLLVVSFSNYDLIGLANMVLYLLFHIIWYDISIKTMLKRIWPVLLLTGIIGIANPFINREVLLELEYVTITYGMVSMVTLMLKGIFCVMASYILTITVGIGQICYAFQVLHMPEEIVTMIMLMHRYLMLLIKEVERMQQAYKLRASKQKGLQFLTWGSFVGLLLLRSMDRAQEVYESMKLRGFHGKMQTSFLKSNKRASIFYIFFWGIVLFFLRMIPIFSLVGNLFWKGTGQ